MAPCPTATPAITTATAVPATTALPSCRGLRCLDREACFEFDAVSRVARRTHASDACDVGGATDALTLAYLPRGGSAASDVERISVDAAQLLMGCMYTTKLLFQSSHMLRNYAFWGFTGHGDEGFATVGMAADAWAHVSPDVAVGHAAMLDDDEDDPGLGLFATGALALGVLLGEYTGMVQVNADTTASHDAYGVCYPSVFERGELRVSALEFGNEIRCINHSHKPNATFTPMIRRGVLHIYCFTTRTVVVGEQIFVDYGSEYWKGAGLEPVAC